MNSLSDPDSFEYSPIFWSKNPNIRAIIVISVVLIVCPLIVIFIWGLLSRIPSPKPNSFMCISVLSFTAIKGIS